MSDPATGETRVVVAAPGAPSLPGSLTRVAARGMAWSVGGGLASAVLSIANIVILSRLLTPAEFGAAAAAGLVVGFATLFSQLGVGPALVQRKDLRDEEVAAALVLSTLLAAALALLMFAATPLVNPLVGLSAEDDLLRLLSVSLLLAGVAAVPAALLQRRLQFRAIATVELLSSSLGWIGMSALLAAQGFGAWSLVWGSVTAAAISALGHGILARPPLRLLGPRRLWRDVRPLLRFGSGHSLAQIGNWLALNADNLVTTNVLGPSALGVYSRAYRLLSQPAQLIGGAADKVLFPAMARVGQNPPRLRSAYLRASSLVSLVAVPGSVALVVLAPEVVEVLLGPGWSQVVLPLQVLAVVLVPRVAYRISGSLTRAMGLVYSAAVRQWLYALEVVVLCGLGAHWAGLPGVALGASVAITLHFLAMLHLSSRVVPGLLRDVLRAHLGKHVPLAAVVAGVTYPVAVALRRLESEVVTLGVGTAVAGLSAVVTVLLLRRFYRSEIEVVSSLLLRRRQRERPEAPAPDASAATEPAEVY